MTKLKKSIIVDIDYTLSIPFGRDIYDFKDSLKDIPNNYVIDILKLDIYLSFDILILTGREEKFRSITVKFLHNNKIPFQELYMRKNKDYRPNHMIKKEIILKEIKPYWDIYFAIDDDPKTIEMYQNELDINSLLVKNKKIIK